MVRLEDNDMQIKSFIVTFGSFIVTTILLYFLGHLFIISWLQMQYEYRNVSNEFYLSIGSFVPILIGLITSFMAEKLYTYRYTNTR